MPKLGNLEDVYGLSPTQQGMLFHSLSAPGSDVYFEQFCYTFKGNLRSATLQAAWRKAVGATDADIKEIAAEIAGLEKQVAQEKARLN